MAAMTNNPPFLPSSEPDASLSAAQYYSEVGPAWSWAAASAGPPAGMGYQVSGMGHQITKCDCRVRDVADVVLTVLRCPVLASAGGQVTGSSLL